MKIRVSLGRISTLVGEGMLTFGTLGSCLAIVLYSLEKKVCIGAHAMLPTAPKECVRESIGRYVDSSIIYMHNVMKKQFNVRRVYSKIAGGATLFKGLANSNCLNVGKRNWEVAQKTLSKLGVIIKAKHVLGDYGRTVSFKMPSAEMIIRTTKGRTIII